LLQRLDSERRSVECPRLDTRDGRRRGHDHGIGAPVRKETAREARKDGGRATGRVVVPLMMAVRVIAGMRVLAGVVLVQRHARPAGRSGESLQRHGESEQESDNDAHDNWHGDDSIPRAVAS
jgi:hypothetical protein